ncbi:MAG: dockerin type I repeat-containing protein [Acutalibacteraceae bacterium]
MKKIIKRISAVLALIIVFSTIYVSSIAETVLLGDVNGDGKVGLADVQELKKYIVGKNKDSDIVVANSDVNKSGLVDLMDLLYIRKYLAKIITDFSTIDCSNLLAKVDNQTVNPQNLGIPFSEKYSSNVYARNIWDMKAVDGKVIMGTGDYGANTGPTPMYYFTNDSAEVHKDANHIDYSNTNQSGGLTTEAIEKFFEIDGNLYTVATDPLGMGQGSYYKYNSETNTWNDYYKLPLTVHCYDMVEYDGYIYFGGMVRSNWSYNGSTMILNTVQRIPKDKLATSTNAENIYFLKQDGVTDFNEEYKDNETNHSGTMSNYWRTYEMFVFKGELYAVHSSSYDFGSLSTSTGLFKYDKDKNKFVMVYDASAKNKKTIISVLRYYTQFTNADAEGHYISPAVARYYSFDDNTAVYDELKCGKETLYGNARFNSTIITDDTFVAVENGIFKSNDLKTFEKVSLGTGYENYVTRDAFEKDGKYYFLASVMNDTNDFTTAVFETDGNFESFRKVLQFDTESFARSFEYNDGYLYISLGANGKTDNSPSAPQSSSYCGTVYRVDLSEYTK